MTREDSILLARSIAIMAAELIIAMLLFGCRAQLVPVPEVHTEYVHDTLRLHDSIHIHTREYIKGDTVHKDSIVYRDRWRDRIVEVHTSDTVPVPVEVEKPVYVRSNYDKFCSRAFWITAALVLLYVVWWCIKTFYLRK